MFGSPPIGEAPTCGGDEAKAFGLADADSNFSPTPPVSALALEPDSESSVSSASELESSLESDREASLDSTKPEPNGRVGEFDSATPGFRSRVAASLGSAEAGSD